MTETDVLMARFCALVAKSCGIRYSDRIVKPLTHLTLPEQAEFSGLRKLAEVGIAAGIEKGVVKARTGEEGQDGH